VADLPTSSRDKQMLLRRIQAAYSAADDLLARLRLADVNKDGVCGHWSVKDVVAHLTTWEARTLRWLKEAEQAIPLTIPEPGFGWHEFDALNAVSYEQNKGRDFHQTRQRIMAAVEALTDAELRGEERFSSMFRDSPGAVIAANTYEHYDYHMAQVHEWLALHDLHT